MIIGEKIKLVIPEEKYFENVYELWTNFEVWKYSDREIGYFSKENFRKNIWEEVFLNVKNSKNRVRFIILEKDTDDFVGDIGAWIHYDRKIANLSINIHPKHQGKGYGFEAMKLFIKFLFDNYPIDIIEDGVFEFNEKSINLHKKLGFEVYGKIPRTVFRFEKWWDEITFVLERSKFYENIIEQK